MPFGPARRVLVMIRWPEVEPVLLTVYRLLDTEAPCGLLDGPPVASPPRP